MVPQLLAIGLGALVVRALMAETRRRPSPRTHQKYRAMVGGVQVDCGITARSLTTRERERRRRMGIPNLYLEPVGTRVSESAARAWEKRTRCSPYR